MSIISASAIESSLGYQISRSVRLRSSASAYFNRTPASAGNRRVMTFSWWMKLGQAAGSVFGAPGTTNPRMQIYYSGPSDGRFELYQSNGAGSQVCYTLTSSRYRDPSAWYHFVIEIDTTQATSSNRIKWYVNGVQLTAFDTAAYPSQNTDMEWNAAVVHNIGRQPNASAYFDGYLTEINFIDGQALTPSSFGQTNPITGVWEPKQYTGTYGTNGFYLNFSDPSAATAAAIGRDYSGNGNNWTPNNISVTAGVTYDSMIDTPTPYADGGNGRGNYAVLNPLDKGSDVLAVEGNLAAYATGAGTNALLRSSIGMTSGKWYWEVQPATLNSTNGNNAMCGIALGTAATNVYLGGNASGWGYYGSNGNKYNNGSASAYGATYGTSDVIGVAFDADAGTLTFYKNNTSQGTAFSGLTSGPYFPAVGNGNSSQYVNFGQRPFAYTPPTGFKALNTQNLPEPTIKKGNLFFDATTYTGNGTARNITNSGAMQPDLVWIKSRSAVGDTEVYDAVRGATKYLLTDTTNAEGTIAQALTAFNSDGFALGTGSGGNDNTNGTTYVAWQWRASDSAPVTNTAGSITSTVSAGVTQGFSVVTYTGTGANLTFGHGLGVKPAMVIVKPRSFSDNWVVWNKNLPTPTTGYLYLNGTGAAANFSGFWNSTEPTSTVVSIGVNSNTNTNGGTFVAYCFAEVPGFSKFGSYTGNGSTDGVFVYCGFRPRWVMVKASSAVESWVIWDTARNTYNTMPNVLYPNLSNAEVGNTQIDLVSNGFKLRNSATNGNISGVTYIFAAFAENPFKNALAR